MDDEIENVDQDFILGLQLQEYTRTGRLQRQLINDAMIPLQQRGRIVPLDTTRKIRMAVLNLQRIVLEFELLEFFVDDLADFARENICRGYRLVSPRDVEVLMVAGNHEVWLHFRDTLAGTYITLFWHLSRNDAVRAIDMTYATVAEAIELIHQGTDGIERGYQFFKDDTVTYPFPGTRRE